MSRTAFRAALAAIALLAPAASAHTAAVRDMDGNERVLKVATHMGGAEHRRLTIALNKAAVIMLDADARDVLVSNPSIVDAVVRSPRRIFLLAQKVGQTNAFFFDAAGHQLLSVDIRVEKDVADLNSVIRAEMPGSNVHVDSLNGNVVLSGSVESQSDATRVADLATRFAADPEKPTDPPKLVNMLSVRGGEQVMLKVRVAEVQRTIAKQFGFNVAAGGLIGSVPMALATDNQFALLGRALASASGAAVGSVCDPFKGKCGGPVGNNPAEATFQALERVGLLHTLAEPDMTAVSGETAKFLAGGEFPVPTGRDRDGNVTIEFKQFGVGLSFTPLVLSPRRISLHISSEVSELTNTGALTLSGGTTQENGQTVTIAGLTIPGLTVRRADTTVELPSGGSFAIAGLMQHTNKQIIDAFPGLKDMPVLGALFRSRDFQNDETELVVVVTPYLVSPTSEHNIAVPTDGFAPPSDIDTILNGSINRTHPPAAPPSAVSQGPTGYIVR